MAAVAAVMLVACRQQTVYYHYEHVPVAGWEKNDTLVFNLPPIADDGRYMQELGVSISSDYPFMGLNLVVEQQNVVTHELRTDTLVCRLVDEQGNAKGRGVSQFQYLFHLNTLRLRKGEQLRVAIRHDMKREILPGITDIGIRLRHNPTDMRDTK